MSNAHEPEENKFSLEKDAGPEIKAVGAWAFLHSTNQLEVSPFFDEEPGLRCYVWLDDARAIKTGDVYDITNHVPGSKASIDYTQPPGGGHFWHVKSGKLHVDHYDKSKHHLKFHFESVVEHNGLSIALTGRAHIKEIIESRALSTQG